jgi:hypothetical protein
MKNQSADGRKRPKATHWTLGHPHDRASAELAERRGQLSWPFKEWGP